MFASDTASLRLIKVKAGQGAFGFLKQLGERGIAGRWNPALPRLVDAHWKEPYEILCLELKIQCDH